MTGNSMRTVTFRSGHCKLTITTTGFGIIFPGCVDVLNNAVDVVVPTPELAREIALRLMGYATVLEAERGQDGE